MSIVKHYSSSLLMTVDLIHRSRAETTIDGKYQFSIGQLTYRNAIIQGTVVSKRSYPKHDLIMGTRQTVDDGTGVLPCIKWEVLNYVALGDVVRVQGTLTVYDNNVQMNLHKRVCEL